MTRHEEKKEKEKRARASTRERCTQLMKLLFFFSFFFRFFQIREERSSLWFVATRSLSRTLSLEDDDDDDDDERDVCLTFHTRERAFSLQTTRTTPTTSLQERFHFICFSHHLPRVLQQQEQQEQELQKQRLCREDAATSEEEEL